MTVIVTQQVNNVVSAPNQTAVDAGQNLTVGVRGKSAYEVAVEEGFSGDEAAWLASLVGAKGDKGDTGATGAQGAKGDKGDAGERGEQGLQGIQGLGGDKGDKGDTGDAGSDASVTEANVRAVVDAVYAPISHTHSIANVTGLQTALDGKQPLATVLTNTTASFTTAQESKLAGIAAGATANSSDSTLLNRANHTGTQLAATISDFAATVRSTVLTGLSTATSTVASATDSILVAIGKLQAQVSLRAPIDSPTFTGTVSGITAAMVGAPSGSGTCSGTNTGDQTNITGNAGTVTTINGRIAAGTNVTLSGTGTAASPYVISASGGGGSITVSQATVDFGAFGYMAMASIADNTVTTSTRVMISIAGTGGRDADELEFSPLSVAAIVKDGIGYDIIATAPLGADGQFNINHFKA